MGVKETVEALSYEKIWGFVEATSHKASSLTDGVSTEKP